MYSCLTYCGKFPETCILHNQKDDTGVGLSKSPNIFSNLFFFLCVCVICEDNCKCADNGKYIYFSELFHTTTCNYETHPKYYLKLFINKLL